MPETTSILRGGIIINEILVDPNSPTGSKFDTDNSGTAENTDEFIELHNNSDEVLSIGGLQLWDAKAGNWFTFAADSTLAAGSYAYVAVGTSGGFLAMPNSSSMAFDAGRRSVVFNNSGDNVVLYDPTVDEFIQLTYNDDGADNPVTDYLNFSSTATRVGAVEDWGRDNDGVSLARDLFSSTRTLRQDQVLSDRLATPGMSNGGGTEFDDVIVGSRFRDTINGGGGKDTISGGKGNDMLRGNSGSDTLKGQDGDDMLYGGLGNDRLVGNSGNDILIGDSGDDNLSGGTGNDELTGGSGNDRLNGGGTAAGEIDILIGRDGADTFVLGRQDGTVLYAEGQGNRGASDRAIIRDFALSEGDVIELAGNASDYFIETYSAGRRSRLLSNMGGTDEIIAVFSDNITTQGADLSSGTGFEFV